MTRLSNLLAAGLLSALLGSGAAFAEMAPKRIVPDSRNGTLIIDLTHPRGTNNNINIYELCLVWRDDDRGKLTYVRIYKNRKGKELTEEREITTPGSCHDIAIRNGDKIIAISNGATVQMSYRLLK